jgi:isopenicillin N synthase-like dioxygenase
MADAGGLLHNAVAAGIVDSVRRLLEEGADINLSVDGLRPLDTAARQGHYAVAQLLLEAAASVDLVEVERISTSIRAPPMFFSINVAPFVRPEDYDEAARMEVARQWDESFQRVGFALIEGHGVPDELVARTRSGAAEFFSKSENYKRHFFRGTSQVRRSGYSPFGSSKGRHEDPVEGYTFMRHVRDGWNMQQDIHPSEMSSFGVEYCTEMERLMHALHRMSAVALGLQPDFFDAYYNPPASVVVVNHYPPVEPLNLKEGTLRYRAHSDYTGFTVLLQGEGDHLEGAGGIEIDIDNNWVAVPPRQGCFVVNIGDLFELWTNDRWRSTPHRVTSPRRGSEAAKQSRLSCMLFSGPHLENVIGPIASCCDERNPARYSPMKASEHLKAMYITKSKEMDYA